MICCSKTWRARRGLASLALAPQDHACMFAYFCNARDRNMNILAPGCTGTQHDVMVCCACVHPRLLQIYLGMITICPHRLVIYRNCISMLRTHSTMLPQHPFDRLIKLTLFPCPITCPLPTHRTLRWWTHVWRCRGRGSSRGSPWISRCSRALASESGDRGERGV